MCSSGIHEKGQVQKCQALGTQRWRSQIIQLEHLLKWIMRCGRINKLLTTFCMEQNKPNAPPLLKTGVGLGGVSYPAGGGRGRNYSTLPLITNSGFFCPQAWFFFFQLSGSHNYKLILPPKLSRSFPSTGNTCQSRPAPPQTLGSYLSLKRR